MENVRSLFFYNIAISSFLKSLKLGSLKGLYSKGIGFQACDTRRIKSYMGAGFQQCFVAGGSNFKKRKRNFKQNLAVFNSK